MFLLSAFCLSMISSILFGTRLVSEWGSDFGVYFVGAMSIDENFGLYSGFFDHKGPTYYAFIKLLDLLVPYSTLGAVVVLSLTCFSWFLSIFFSARILDLSYQHVFFLIVIGSALITDQPSNSSIGIFLASLQILFFTGLIKFRSSQSHMWLFFSVLIISLAILTRIDSVLLIPLYLYFIGLRRVKEVLLAVSAVVFGVLLFLILFSIFLNFSLAEFWYQAVLFNFTTYPSISGTLGFNSHFWSLLTLIKFLFYSGLVLLIAYVLFMSRDKLKNRVSYDFEFLLVFGLFLFFIVGSGKDYHRFIFFAFLVSAFFMLDPKIFRFKIFSVFIGVVLLLNSFYLSTLYSQSKCLFSYCTSPFDELASKSSDYLFFVNQGWPYLIAGRHPDVSFTSFFPLMVNIKTASESLLLDIRANSEKTIVLTKSDYYYLSQDKSSFLDEFLLGRAEPKEEIPGYLFFSPK